jgi:hypothetical protein
MNNQVFYGCYQNKYRWECTMFENFKEADDFAWLNAKDSFSTIIPVNRYYPEFLQKIIVNNKVKNISNVEFCKKEKN